MREEMISNPAYFYRFILCHIKGLWRNGSRGTLKMFWDKTQTPVKVQVLSTPLTQKGEPQMSYEGYEEHICKNGHYFTSDPFYFDDVPNCPYCKVPAAWTNSVDQTNYYSQGEIGEEVLAKHFLVEPEVVETCNLGYMHTIKQAVYRIPTHEEVQPLRKYYDEETGKEINLIRSK